MEEVAAEAGREEKPELGYLGTTPPSGKRELGELCILQKCELCSTGVLWPCLTSPLMCFQHTVLTALNLGNKELFGLQPYAPSPDRNPL